MGVCFCQVFAFFSRKKERREESYDLKSAVALFNECVENLKKDSPVTEVYLAALSFLARSSEAGVYYRQEVDGMEHYVLNDVKYDFKPLEVFVPDSAYKVDEKELEKSIEKNRAIIARTRENRKRHLQNGKIST